MQGIAWCRKCGNTVRGKIGIDLTCPYCSRILKIPNEPIYYLEKPTPLQGIKRVSFMGILDFIVAQKEEESDIEFSVEIGFNVQPIRVERRSRPISPIPVAHLKAAVRQFKQFTIKRIDEMVGFSREGILGAEKYIITLRRRIIRLDILLK